MRTLPRVTRSVLYISYAIAFHYGTWRTIVNVGFHGVNQIKLHDGEPPHRTAHIILNQKLALRIVNDHIIGTGFSSPHIDRRFDNSLTFTSTSYCQPGNSQNLRLFVNRL